MHNVSTLCNLFKVLSEVTQILDIFQCLFSHEFTVYVSLGGVSLELQWIVTKRGNFVLERLQVWKILT